LISSNRDNLIVFQHVKIEDAYNAWSATYDSDRNRTRDLDQQVAREELQNLRCNSVLELGCGTGKNTALLAQIGGRVRSLDFSAGMIEKAWARTDSPNVTFEIADITKRWPSDDQAFDLVVCNLVLEHVEDLGFIFAEGARVLSTGGRLLRLRASPVSSIPGNAGSLSERR
jgi:malonyl-CoA O-methyltransferase